LSTIAVTTGTAETVGDLLRFWRQRRRLSQQELALEANVSTRHLSFIETGRARASRQLLVHLSDTLSMPLRERNRLLLAGGFAPRYRELPFDDREMRILLDSLQTLLSAHEPNPALIVDAHWNLIAHNAAAALLWTGVDPSLLEPPVNVLRLACHPEGLPKISTMTPVCNRGLLDRLRRRAQDDADQPLLDLIKEMDSYLTNTDDTDPRPLSGDGVTATFGLHTQAGTIDLFTVIATLGAPLEVTAASLAIETFLPTDANSATKLRQLADSRQAHP
jgi:transcriptional regulator with XRE-family HTH domain